MRMMTMLCSLIVTAAIPMLEAGDVSAGRSNRRVALLNSGIEELAEATSPAVVHISARGRMRVEPAGEGRQVMMAQRETTGSGVIVDACGYIVTSAHVVYGARKIEVSVRGAKLDTAGKVFPAKLVGLDQETDLAVLKIEADNLPALSFRDSDALKQGQIVVALGSPLGLQNTLTVGFVSALARYMSPDQPVAYVQTDAPINPGSSGGPLLDTDGNIAGINTMILTYSGGNEGIGLAVPSNTVRAVYEGLRRDGRVIRASIGVVSQDVNPNLAAALGLDQESRVILSDVRPGSAAEAAGLEPGDIVLALDGNPVKEGRQVMMAVFQRRPGDTISLKVRRGMESLDKQVVLAERKQAPRGISELANEGHLVRSLGILALTVDQNVIPFLGEVRRPGGVVVVAIPSEHSAVNPGLSAGDIIYEVNRKRIDSAEQLIAELGTKKPADPIALLVEHDGTLGYVSFEFE